MEQQGQEEQQRRRQWQRRAGQQQRHPVQEQGQEQRHPVQGQEQGKGRDPFDLTVGIAINSCLSIVGMDRILRTAGAGLSCLNHSCMRSVWHAAVSRAAHGPHMGTTGTAP